MLYNFRIDRSGTQEILRRLEEDHLLSQGWGGGDKEDLEIGRRDFAVACKKCYGLASTRIPTNLTRMAEFKDGDILVTPHLPADGKVSIHVVDGDFPACYSYLRGDTAHLNHRIKVKQSYGLAGNVDCHNASLVHWYGKLQWMRLPVLRMEHFADDFEPLIAILAAKPTQLLDASPLVEYLSRQVSKLVAALKAEMRSINASNSPTSFESVCRYLLEANGYTVTCAHQYDGKGGDVDFRCTIAKGTLSPFEMGDSLLLVQAKKHTGVTDKEAVKQLLQMMKSEPDANACVMSLGDDFTSDARDMAEKNGIQLLDGNTICRMLLQTLLD